MTENQPIQIPQTLLKTKHIQNKDTISQKCNEYIQIEPPMVKFTGFEINKLNTMKIRVINKAQIQQRVHVLPIESDIFSVQFKKKGYISSGLAEEITIQFKPPEYKYYYETLKINTETENLIVPIHAYPVLDRENLRNIFPRLIDFGTIEIGEQRTITYQLECKIPINFEFEFVYTKENQEITIYPIKGIIPGDGKININITYIPQNNFTVISEAELKVSQFDFEPIKIRLMGSGRYKDPQENKQKKIQSASNKQNSKRPQSNNRLEKLSRTDQNKENQIEQQAKYRIGSAYSQIPSQMQSSNKQNKQQSPGFQSSEQEFMQQQNEQEGQENIMNQTFGQQTDLVNTNTERFQQEKLFVNKCSAVQLLQKNKDIKFFQCVGDQDITEEEIQQVQQQRINFKQNILDQKNNEGQTRYSIILDNDQPLIDFNKAPYQEKVTWDFDKNNDLKHRKIILGRFMSAATKIILRKRAQKRLQKIKNLLGDATTREEVKKLVAQDWQKAEYMHLSKKQNINFSFKYDFNKVQNILFPIQYEASNSFNNFTFQIEERKSFDDLHTYDVMQKNHQELMKYEKMNVSPYHIYPSIENIREQRTGNECEYSIRGKMGISKTYQEYGNQINNLSKTFLKQLDIPLFTFITQHNSLRPYVQLSQSTETDEQYFLKPETLMNSDNLDPLVKKNGNLKLLKSDFFAKTPGYFSKCLLDEDTSELCRYSSKLLNLPFDTSNIKFQEYLFQNPLNEPLYEDNLTEDDSDGETPPNIQVQNVDDFIKVLEDKDNQMVQLREKNKSRLPFDENELIYENINKNQNIERNKRISTVYSKANNFNKFIKDNNNKLILL